MTDRDAQPVYGRGPSGVRGGGAVPGAYAEADLTIMCPTCRAPALEFCVNRSTGAVAHSACVARYTHQGGAESGSTGHTASGTGAA